MKTTSRNNKFIIVGAIFCLAFLACMMVNAMEVKAVSCNEDLDCGKDYWEGQYCQSNSVYGVYADWSCNKTSETTIGICVLTKTNKQVSSCSSSQVCVLNHLKSDYTAIG